MLEYVGSVEPSCEFGRSGLRVFGHVEEEALGLLIIMTDIGEVAPLVAEEATEEREEVVHGWLGFYEFSRRLKVERVS